MADPAVPWRAAAAVVACTTLAYAAVGWLALLVALPPGYASPLYPSAGIALAAVLTCGRAALLGTALGSFLVNLMLSASRGPLDAAALLLPAVIGIGAAAQAALGVALIRRFLPGAQSLGTPREIVGAGLLAGFVACTLNPTLATLALRISGTIGSDAVAHTWGTWWVGDALGVLIGAPVVLAFIGHPRADWASRRRSVALPLMVATLLLGAATLTVRNWDEERVAIGFEREAEGLAAEAAVRLARPIDALQALAGVWLAGGTLTPAGLRAASRWWLAQPLELQAMGYSPRVARADIPAFETLARDGGLAGFRVFDRGTVARTDADVVAVRMIEPPAGNAGALGVNSMSVPAARAAIERTRASGAPAATQAFQLAQSASADETGIVIYQALADATGGFAGVVFVTVRAERLLKGLAPASTGDLRWCLIDRAAGAARPRLAGDPGCDRAPAARYERSHRIAFAQRDLELRVYAQLGPLTPRQQADAWLFSVVGMVAATMLGALLLTVTGRARRIALAVDAGTAELRREVAERSLAEQALRNNEARLRGILDNVPIGVMFLDLRGRIDATNPRFAEMLGRTAAQLQGLPLAALAHPDEAVDNQRQIDDLLARRTRTSRRQMRLLRADGHELFVRTHLTLLDDHAGQPLRLAGAVEDITEHLRLEESERARARAEAANRAKSDFVSRMSHELRTPLNAMIGFAQLLGLERDPPLAPHQREWTAQIQRAGWHLLEMINDTLDLARIESGAVQLSLKAVDLRIAAAASMSLVAGVAAQRGIVVRDGVEADAGVVLADETRLKQVLTNLLSNAVKYNREGGSVLLTSRRDGHDSGGRVAISVRDSGLGMTPEQLAALFQPYNRLGRENSAIEGTGIGLVISRRLAELMGGTLDVASTAGEGSTFTLRLPAAALDGAVAAVAPDDGGIPPYRQRRVHYIEDNPTNVEVMRGILQQRPQIALEVSTIGLDGLQAVRQQRPDVILLDMQLPDISGLELLRHLKQDDEVADVPVVVVSADATTARMQEALTLGAAHYVTKPVDIARFLQTMDGLLQALETRWGPLR